MTVEDYLLRYRWLRGGWYSMPTQYRRNQAIKARCDWLLVVAAAKVAR